MQILKSKHLKVADFESGYVLVSSAIVLCAVGLLSASSILFFSFSSNKNARLVENSAKAKGLANACAEIAVQKLTLNSSLTGTFTQTFSSGSCSYVITQQSTSASVITATGSVNAVVRKAQVTVNRNPVSITKWQEIP